MKALAFFLLSCFCWAFPLSGYSQPDAVLNNPSACNLNLPLTDNSCQDNGTFFEPNEFQIVVSGVPGTQLGVDVYLQEVRIIIAHTWANDLDITLVSPAGVRTLLTSDNGGGDDNYGDPTTGDCSVYTSFQYGSCTDINSGIAPFTEAIYQPEESFLQFNDNTTNPNGNWSLVVCDDLIGDVGTLEFVELIFAPISCLAIGEVQIDAIDSTSVFLSYTPDDFCGTIIAEYGMPGFLPGTDSTAGAGQVSIVSCSPLSLQNLAENTLYELYLRRYCPATETYSANTCPVTFRTGCLPGEVTETETFDQETLCSPFCGVSCSLSGNWRNSSDDDFDWIVHTGATPTPGTGPQTDISGSGNYIYIETNGNSCASGSSAYLYSACFELNKAAKDSCHLSFNYHMRGISVGALRLQASDDGGFSWSTLWQRNGMQGSDWQKAYIGLDSYSDGTALQLRFEAAKGLGVFGDIALDQIQLYGSAFMDFPTQQYYVDTDNDGFGQPGDFVLSCLAEAPPGYASNAADCNDSDPAINPAATEIACNGIDENCNSDELDDDPFLAPPAVTHDTICSGALATVCATVAAGNTLVWFTDAAGTQFFSSDSCLQLQLPAHAGPGQLTYQYYAKEFSAGCFSPESAAATITVYPNPAGWLVGGASLCPADTLDLAQLDLRDTAFTNASVSFFTDFPLTDSHLLSDTRISPVQTTTFAYLLTSEHGCLDSALFDVDVLNPPLIDFSPADSFSVCLEGMETLTAIVSGGTGEFDYLWSTGATSATIQVAGLQIPGARDTLSIQVTDAAGCIAEDSVQITTTTSIDSVRVFTTPVSNCGGSDGAFAVVPLNGSAPFTYQWTGTDGSSGSQTTTDTFSLTNLSEGAFRVTITDASAIACAVRLRNIRVQGPGFEVNEPNLTEPACRGDNTGSICLNVSGSSNLSYSWNTGSTTDCLENLAAGNYTVTITNGPCTTVEQYEITEPAELQVFPSLRPSNCFDVANGAIFLSIAGGTSPYSVLWNDSETGTTRSQLLSGEYRVTISDANACTLMDTFLLPGPDTLRIAVDSISNISCPGATDGYILVSGQGGFAAYDYSWEDGSTSPLRFNLEAGSYQLTLTDAVGCQVEQTFTIVEPDSLRLLVDQLIQPLCRGDNTGQITLTTLGGTAPFVYLWDGFFQTSNPTLSGLGVNEYFVMATDARACVSDTIRLNLTSATQLSLNVNSQSPVCVGDTSGSLELLPNGFGPFSFQWENGDTTAIRTDLGVGPYTVTITDGQACVYDTTLVLQAPQIFDITPVVSQPSCAGTDDGIINLILQQTGPASNFVWNDGSQHAQRFDLEPGAYSFTVTDVNNCRYISDTFELAYPEPLRLQVLEMGGIRCAGDATGFIETEISGGTPPYQVSWVGQGASTPSIYGLMAGDYRLLIFDSRGCPLDTTLRLEEPLPLIASAELRSGDPCLLAGRDTLLANASGGMGPYAYLWTDSISGPEFLNPLPDDYALTVVDANNCRVILPNIKVRERPLPIKLDSFVVQGVSCFGEEDASMTAYTSGGSSQLQYLFTPSFTEVTDTNVVGLNGLAHYNRYSVTVTDLVTGCQVISPEVSPVLPLPINISKDDFEVVNCFGGSDGALYVSVNGGTEPYTYEWYRADTLIAQTQDLVFAQSGTHTLIVTDAKQCTATFTDSSIITVNEVIQIVDSLSLFVPAACQGESSGGVTPFVTGGAPPYTYNWSNGAMTAALTNVEAGIYALTITDSDTCRAIFNNITVSESSTDLMAIDTMLQHIRCFGGNDGQISLTISGGQDPYTYSWKRDGVLLTNRLSPQETNLVAGNYLITVEDSLACKRTFNLILTEPALLQVFIDQIPPGNGTTLGASVEGGTPPYSYLWSNGSQLDTLMQLAEGTFTLTITDANGCQDSSTYLLTDLMVVNDIGAALRLYPNPAKDVFYLEWNDPLATALNLELRDASGQVVWQTKQDVLAGQQLTLYPRSLAAGIYFVRIQATNGQLYYGKVVLVD